MIRTSRLMIVAGLAVCLSLTAIAHADDTNAKKKAVDPALMDPSATSPTETVPAGDLSAEVAALRREVAAMRDDMRKVLTELQAIKVAQTTAAAAPKAAPRRRPALDMLGKVAPEAKLTAAGAHSDKEVVLGGKSEKVKVAIFFASWCGYCKRALPTLEALNKEYAGKDVEIVAISLDAKAGQRAKTEPEILAVFEQLGMSTVPMAWDPDRKVGNEYKVQSFPTSFVIGKNGIVEAVHIGGPADLSKQIQGEVDKLLAGESLVKAANS